MLGLYAHILKNITLSNYVVSRAKADIDITSAMKLTLDDTRVSLSAAGVNKPRRGRRPSNLGYHQSSTNNPSSSDTSLNAISFEASPHLYFSELESMINLSDSSSEVISYDTTDLVVDRVQSRLLQKHIKSGRLVSAFSTIDVKTHNAERRHQLGGSGSNIQRRFNSTLTFRSNIHDHASTDMPIQSMANQNESFPVIDADILATCKRAKKSAAASGLALLQK